MMYLWEKMKIHPIILFSFIALSLPCFGAKQPLTLNTKRLVRELLETLDSTDFHAARKEAKIDALKSRLPSAKGIERYDLCMDIADEYSKYISDSTMFYLDDAYRSAVAEQDESRMIEANILKASMLSKAGFYYEANDLLGSIPRKELNDESLVAYYNCWTLLYRNLYTSNGEPEEYQKKYREHYNTYRDSLLMVADTLSFYYLFNMEKKAARAGQFDEARRYNAIRMAQITDPKSGAMATCLYDRFMIAYYYEGNLTDEAIDDLLRCAIIEVTNSNKDIASLIRVESYLISINEIKAAKKVSDYYYNAQRIYGSRKRLLDGIDKAMEINRMNQELLQRRKREMLIALLVISALLVALVLLIIRIAGTRTKIVSLNERLQRSDSISKGYIGVVFQLYSSYIKRLDVFRTKIHSSLLKGKLQQALELTSPMNDFVSEELKELYHNFDSAFVAIFPDFIETINSCFLPESRIVPKKTEILTTELRILALIKLGINDSTKIAELLHCSVKTVYNLRSILKSRLAMSVDEFTAILDRL